MGRDSAYEPLLRAFERQAAAGEKISPTRAAKAAKCDRTVASRLFHHGLGPTETAAARPPIREVLGLVTAAAELDPDALLLDDLRGTLRTLAGHVDRIASGLPPDGDPMDALDRLARVVASIVGGLTKLAEASKALGGRKPTPARGAAPDASPPPSEDEATVRARLEARAKELGEGVQSSQDHPSDLGYGLEVGETSP